MRRTLAHAIIIGEDDDTVPVKKVLEHLYMHLQHQRNITLRRVIFEECRQHEGTPPGGRRTECWLVTPANTSEASRLFLQSRREATTVA